MSSLLAKLENKNLSLPIDLIGVSVSVHVCDCVHITIIVGIDFEQNLRKLLKVEYVLEKTSSCTS